MINIEELKDKTSNFIEKFEKIQEEMRAAEGTVGSWYESLDENYDLVFIRVALLGLVASVCDKDWTPIFYYLEDEEWTIGDLMGGYLDLYFER